MRTNLFVYLVLIAVVDVFVPNPILALLLIWVVAQRPAWFRNLVHSVYDEGSRT